jgi:hypothetical protein
MTIRIHVTSAPCEGTLQLHNINPLNAELNPICHLLALLGGATIVVISRLRVNMVCLILKGHIPIKDNPWSNHLPPRVRK